MAYDGTIPSLSNQIGNDIPQMQENFSLLESAQVVDEGSTQDGDYIVFENGWAIVLNFFERVDDVEATDRGDGFFRISLAGYFDVNLPVNFSDNFYFYINGDVRNGTSTRDLVSIWPGNIDGHSGSSWSNMYLGCKGVFDTLRGFYSIAIGRVD